MTVVYKLLLTDTLDGYPFCGTDVNKKVKVDPSIRKFSNFTFPKKKLM